MLHGDSTDLLKHLGKAFKQVYGRQHLLRMMIDDHSYFVGLESDESEALFPALSIYATDLHLECGLSSTLPSPPPSPTLTTKSVKYAWTLLELRKVVTGCLRIIQKVP